MVTGFFQTLHGRPGLRGHPVWAALLYAFCPAAARWWLAGAEPEVPFDPFWAVLSEKATGRTLAAVLSEWGLEDLIPFARKFVARVEAYREQLPVRHIRAPELLPTFRNGAVPLGIRHRLAVALARVGGWRGFYDFVRIWAFSGTDWQSGLNMPGIPAAEFSPLSIGPEAGAVLPAWRLVSGRREALALMAPGAESCGMLFEDLGVRSAASAPECRALDLFVLDASGGVRRAAGRLGRAQLDSLIGRLSEAARRGPHPPLRGLERPGGCRLCPYAGLCWRTPEAGERELTSLALDFGSGT